MSVIGRLDGQVDEVLIKPIGKRNRKDEVETSANSQKPEGGAQPETKSEPPKSEADQRPTRPPELPVWLL